MPQTVDYDALAAQHGGVDYDKLAAESGATEQPQASSVGDRVRQGVRDALDSGAAMPFGVPPDFVKGAAAGLASTVFHGGDLIRRGLGMDRVIDQPQVQQAMQPPATPMGQAGKMAEQTAEFFAPASVLGKAKAAVKTGTALDALFNAALEGGSAAAVSSAQKGTTEGAGKTAALTAGVAATAPAAFSAGGKVLNWLGERVERALVKPSIADVKDGFNVGNIFKYNLGGSLSQTYEKTQAAIQQQSDKLKQYLNMSNQLGRKVNLLNELADVASDLEQKAARNFGQNASIRGAVDKLLNDPLFQKISQNGDVDLATANEVKQAVGEMGAWLHDPSGRVLGDADKAMETVANALYGRLKNAINAQAVGPLAAANKALSELIPIRQAIIRRIPVEQRANVLNMGDLMGLSMGHLGLSLANRILKSGQFADLASQAGTAMQGMTPGLGTTAARATAAAATTPQ